MTVAAIDVANGAMTRHDSGERIHVGYLAYLAGDNTTARGYFEAEKQAFPESGAFVDFLLEGL